MTMDPEEVYDAIHEIWKKSGWSQREAEAVLCEAQVAVLEGTKRLKICYHGTEQEAVASILEDGFWPGTYFAQHLEDAIGFGGKCVFEVCFPQSATSRSGWQFVDEDGVPPDRIVRCKRYDSIETLYENKALGKEIFRSNLTEEERKRLDEEGGNDE